MREETSIGVAKLQSRKASEREGEGEGEREKEKGREREGKRGDNERESYL